MEPKKSKINGTFPKQSLPIWGTGIFSLFLLALVFPEAWWGIHFLNFVAPTVKVGCLLVVAGLLVFSWWRVDQTLQWTASKDVVKNTKMFLFLGGLIAALVFYNVPIAGDIYGNSRGFSLHITVQELSSDFYSNLFSFEFVPGNGREGVKMIVEFISYAFQVSIYDAVKLMDAFCGGTFVVVWLLAVRHFINVRGWQWIVALTGLTSPFLLIYFGHVETYAPVYLIVTVWILLFVLFMREKKSAYYWWLLPLLCIGVRLHTLMYLLMPALIIASAYKFNVEKRIAEKLTHLSQTLRWIYLPLFVGGLFLYFFIFEDYNDPRTLTDFEDIDRLFLPMVSPAEPLDNYNMFSWNHIADFFNAILLWSPALLFLFGYLAVLKRKALDWSKLEVNMLIVTFLLFATLLFAMNPLFSMPMDWDLFCFPVPILLVVLLLLVEQVQFDTVKTPVISGSVGMMLLCLPAFGVLLSKPNNSYRAERVALHIYKTYYEHASTYMLMSLSMIDDKDVYRKRIEGLIAEMEPYATPNNDKQYSDILIDKATFDMYVDKNPQSARKMLIKSMEYRRLPEAFDRLAYEINVALVKQQFVFSQEDQRKAAKIVENGKRLLREKREYEAALKEFRYSRYYNPVSGTAIMFSVEALFRMQRFPEAYDYAVDLVALQYPDYRTALRIGIHTALEAKRYGEALRYCDQFLQNFEPEETIVTVKRRLQAKERIEELKFLFNRGN